MMMLWNGGSKKQVHFHSFSFFIFPFNIILTLLRWGSICRIGGYTTHPMTLDISFFFVVRGGSWILDNEPGSYSPLQ